MAKTILLFLGSILVNFVIDIANSSEIEKKGDPWTLIEELTNYFRYLQMEKIMLAKRMHTCKTMLEKYYNKVEDGRPKLDECKTNHVYCEIDKSDCRIGLKNCSDELAECKKLNSVKQEGNEPLNDI